MVNFQFQAIPAEPFSRLSAHTDEELAELGIRRVVVDESPGYPCRVSLSDAEKGEVVYLLSHVHHDVASPYRAAGPVFVRECVAAAKLAPNEIPLMLRHRLLSVRAYNEAAFMLEADVVQGVVLEDTIQRFLENPAVSYLHVHNAKQGCFNCRVERA